jgi:hypothetical protein
MATRIAAAPAPDTPVSIDPAGDMEEDRGYRTWREMDSNFRFRAFLSLRSSSVFSIPRSRYAEGTDAESGTEAISLKRKESGGLPIAVGCTRSKSGRVPCLHICWAEQCEPDILLYRSPTNAFSWRKPDAIHRRYLETSPRHCPGRGGRVAPVAVRAARLSAASP